MSWEQFLIVPEKTVVDFFAFTAAQREAVDIDPLYPVMRQVLLNWYPPPVDDEIRLWAVLVYVAYYNAASALTALDALPAWTAPTGDLARLPTGIERRGLRGGTNLTQHLEDVIFRSELHGSFTGWLQEGWTGDPLADWTRTRDNALVAWGNGRWATYKLAEVLQKVLGWPIAADDMGMDGASGPKHCLEMMFGPGWSNENFERQGLWLWSQAIERGIDVDLAEIETCLCDFHNVASGRYYVGHDVGLLYDDVHKLADGPARAALLAAADTELPPHYWRPVEPKRKRVYSETGELATW